MKICLNCGARCEDRDVFCQNCGQRLTTGGVQYKKQTTVYKNRAAMPFAEETEEPPMAARVLEAIVGAAMVVFCLLWVGMAVELLGVIGDVGDRQWRFYAIAIGFSVLVVLQCVLGALLCFGFKLPQALSVHNNPHIARGINQLVTLFAGTLVFFYRYVEDFPENFYILNTTTCVCAIGGMILTLIASKLRGERIY